jgi:hypothetical protein
LQRPKQHNRGIVKVGAWIEQVFGAIAQMEGKLLPTIGQARADLAMMMAVCYHLKRLTYVASASSAAS